MSDGLQELLAPKSDSLWLRFGSALSQWDRQRKKARAVKLPLPVVSVGGLTLGGAGKTPLTAALAERLSSHGYRVGILSRGYRRRSRGPLLVSTGSGPLQTVRAAGDEPFLLASALPGVAVAVARQRQEAGELLLKAVPNLDLFLLDDGFSHRQLFRNLELVVLSREDPFGDWNFPPFGRLRVAPSALQEAHAAIWIESLQGPPVDPADLRATLAAVGFAGPIFRAMRQWDPPYLVDSRDQTLIPGTRIVAVSGIARPEGFREALRLTGLLVQHHLVFPDHHSYPSRSLNKIRQACERTAVPLVVTTLKDLPKLEGGLAGLQLAVLPYRVEPEPGLFDWVTEQLVSSRK